MGIYKRENGYWYAYCPWRKKMGLPHRIALGTTIAAKAKKLYTLLEEERFTGTVAGKSISIPEFIEKYINEYCQPPRKTPQNVRQERTRLMLIGDFLTSINCLTLSQISPYHGERLIKHLTEIGKSPKTVNHYLGHLKTALNVAVQWGYLKESPLRNVKPVKVTNVRAIRALTLEEVKRLLKVSDEDTANIIKLYFYTGMRLSEAANLHWKDVNLDHKIITIQSSGEFSPKSRKVRHIPLSDEAVEFIRELPHKGDYVLSNGNGEKLYKRSNNYSRRIRKAMVKAGVYEPGSVVHALRHTYISLLCKYGVAPTFVQSLAGHSDIQTTMRYVHQFPIKDNSDVQKLSLNGDN